RAVNLSGVGAPRSSVQSGHSTGKHRADSDSRSVSVPACVLACIQPSTLLRVRVPLCVYSLAGFPRVISGKGVPVQVRIPVLGLDRVALLGSFSCVQSGRC
uniref:Uncharacterized protein n=1 Tax=Anopheles albimanus TaxID=7167 RepID=A0A182FX50_ANOAL